MRSLGSTLTSAAATFALFAAANWGPVMFAVMFLTATESFIQLLVVQTISTVGFPQVGLYQSIENAIKVWRVKKALRILRSSGIAGRGSDHHQLPEHDCIAIMAVCPLFLQVPPRSMAELLPYLRSVESDDYHTREELSFKWCPLELWPAANIKQKDLHTTQSADEEIKADGAQGIQAHHLHMNDVGAPDKALGKYIEVLHAEDRVALLVSGLVPRYKELRYLRTRNRFQTAVTTLQAGGYMLGLVERIVQHLDISPIEAIISFLCLLAALQLLIDLYACSNYQRHLLLHLNSHQVSCWIDQTLKNHDINFALDSERNKLGLINLTGFTCSNVLLFLMSLPLIYYVYHYWHVSLMSALAALLFILAMTASSVLLTRDEFSGSEQLCRWDYAIPVPLIKKRLPLSEVCSGVVCGGAMALAVVATVVDWHTFRQPPFNWFAWILPHASTS